MSETQLTWIEGICGVGGFFVICAALPLQSGLLLSLGVVMCAVGWCAKLEWEKRTGMTRDFD